MFAIATAYLAITVNDFNFQFLIFNQFLMAGSLENYKLKIQQVTSQQANGKSYD